MRFMMEQIREGPCIHTTSESTAVRKTLLTFHSSMPLTKKSRYDNSEAFELEIKFTPSTEVFNIHVK